MIISDNTRITVLQLAFDRLAVRVEVLLEAKDNFDEVLNAVLNATSVHYTKKGDVYLLF